MVSKKDLEDTLKKAEKDLKEYKEDLKNEINHTQIKFYKGMISATENLIKQLKKRIRELS